jgi:hypothetical protein
LARLESCKGKRKGVSNVSHKRARKTTREGKLTSKTSPRIVTYSLSWLLAYECWETSPELKTYCFGQIRFPRMAMTKTAHPQMNQMIMLIASFSRHASRTSGRFIPPIHLSSGVGSHHVNAQTKKTHFFLAGVSVTFSAVSPPTGMLISSTSRPLSCRPVFSAPPNMFREGA